MAVTATHLPQPPEVIFQLLLNPTTYPDWLVGAKRIRAVDPDWPAPGSRFHHSVGVGPLVVEDSTVIEAADPPRTLTLRARARPAGVARVVLRLRPTDDGGTHLEMDEKPISGPARWFHNPLLEAAIAARNRRSLQRLAGLVRPGA